MISTEPASSGASVVELEGVSAGYDRTLVLEDVDLDVRRGQVLALVGPNGGGKTTVLRLILGLLPPRQGTVRVLGGEPRQVRHRIGYLPQAAQLDPSFPATVWDTVAMGRLRPTWLPQRLDRRDQDLIHESLGDVRMLGLENRLVGTLSGGQRQRVLLARALVTEPELLLLDEPAAGLDPEVTAELYELLTSLSREVTVIMISHNLEAVHQYATSIGIVDRRITHHHCQRHPSGPGDRCDVPWVTGHHGHHPTPERK
jgi:zinc transport system ATP-binding protein